MPVGTRSLLFGAHQFLIHPFFMFIAWWKLFGFPWDPRLWAAFVVHDWGYWGKKDMDGPDGEKHVELGARIMHRWFDDCSHRSIACPLLHKDYDLWKSLTTWRDTSRWYDLCLLHSRFYAKKADRPFSKLCVCDKQVIISTPWWIYLPLAHLSGEVHEYMARVATGKYKEQIETSASSREWHRKMVDYIRGWVAEHKNKTEDAWTRV